MHFSFNTLTTGWRSYIKYSKKCFIITSKTSKIGNWLKLRPFPHCLHSIEQTHNKTRSRLSGWIVTYKTLFLVTSSASSWSLCSQECWERSVLCTATLFQRPLCDKNTVSLSEVYRGYTTTGNPTFYSTLHCPLTLKRVRRFSKLLIFQSNFKVWTIYWMSMRMKSKIIQFEFFIKINIWVLS